MPQIAMENKKNIESAISKATDYYKKRHAYVPIQSYTLDFTEEEKDIISSTPDLFFMASKSRTLLIVWLCEVIRNTFELYNYSDLEMPTETYEIMRNTFRTKAFNRNVFLDIFNCKNSNTLSYNDFVTLEQHYINTYNKFAPEENKISVMPHIKVKKDEEKIVYNRELKNIFAKTKNKEVILARANGQTLEKIGNSLGITRERTRQIEFKPLNDIERWLISREQDIKDDLVSENGLLNDSKAMKVLGKDEWKIIKYVISRNSENKSPWKYYEPLDLTYYNPEKRLEEVLENAKDKISEDGKANIEKRFTQEVIKNGFLFWNEKYTERYFKACNYSVVNETLYQGKITIGKAILFVSKKYYPDGIKITDETELNNFIDKIKQEFNIDVSHKRAFLTRIQDILVMRGKAEYISPETINVQPELLKTISDYVSSMDCPQVSYEVIFNALQEEIKKYSDIDNFYYLHGVMKYFADNNELDVKCNRYYAAKPSHEDFTSKEFFNQFYEYLKTQTTPASADELLEKFPEWNPLYFRYSMNYFPSIVQWDKGQYFCLDALKFNKADVEKLRKYLSKCTDNEYGYTTSYKVYNEIKDKEPLLLTRLHITNENNAFYVIQYLVNDYYCRKPHILKDCKTDKFSTIDLVRLEASKSKVVNKKELTQRLVNLYGEKNSSLILAIQKELSTYKKISNKEYQKP